MNRKSLPVFLMAMLLVVVVVSSCGTSSPSAGNKSDQMKTIGIIGGVSWQSSIEFGEFSKQERLANKGDWGPLRKTMLDAARSLKKGGADFIVIASNTMNSTADIIQKEVGIPVIHIADATGKQVQKSGIKTVALLGTTYTMEENFYRDRLENKYGLKVVTPNKADRDYINKVIFDELCAGKFNQNSRARFAQIIEGLAKQQGAQGVILGCTEIPLLISQKDVSIPVFDTTKIHSEAAVDYALQKSSTTKP